MLSNSEIIEQFQKIGALLKGHFILSSGLHSDTYLQCALIMSYPDLATKLLKQLAHKIDQEFGIANIDIVVSPAMGGVIVGYELAKQLGKRAIFCERPSGQFEFRRGFKLEKNARVLVVEDVVTTGKSSKETFKTIAEAGGNVVAEACIVDRSEGKADLGVPLISLADIRVKIFNAENIPQDLQNMQAIKPGSRVI